MSNSDLDHIFKEIDDLELQVAALSVENQELHDKLHLPDRLAGDTLDLITRDSLLWHRQAMIEEYGKAMFKEDITPNQIKSAKRMKSYADAMTIVLEYFGIQNNP